MATTVEIADHIAVVTMRWPHKRNALAPEDGDEVAAAIRRAAADDTTRVVVLTGDGAFCSGGDLRAFGRISEASDGREIKRTVYGRMQAIVRALRDCPVPTIAAVDGPAIGLGFDLALACDMRFIGPGGFLQQGWARAGLVHGVGGVPLLERLAPGLLWRLIANQERLDGARCEHFGLGEVGQPDALAASLTRGVDLAPLRRDVLEHYVTLARLAAWPDENQFEVAARIQGDLIGSHRFRQLVDHILAARPAPAALDRGEG